MIPNLGRVLTILITHDVREVSMHADVSAWGAPSECHDDVSRGEAQRWRETRKHAEAVARRPFRVIAREAKQRGGFVLNTSQRSCAHLFDRIYAKVGFPY